MPAHSDIPPGLSPEEKKAYIRERNRLKQARLRARRNGASQMVIDLDAR